MARLIDDLLSLSRIQLTSIERDPRPRHRRAALPLALARPARALPAIDQGDDCLPALSWLCRLLMSSLAR